jgi:hypothetical protein
VGSADATETPDAAVGSGSDLEEDGNDETASTE